MPAYTEKKPATRYKKQQIEALAPNSVASDILPDSLISAFHVLPLREHNGIITVAAARNCSLKTLEELRFAVGKNIKVVYKEQAWIDQEIKKRFPHIGTAGKTAVAQGLKQALRTFGNEDTPTVDLVNDIINNAIKHNASDIHVEPLEKELRIRYRMDGVLVNSLTIPLDKKAAFISRLKIMADLDIAEKRRPQDGRIRQQINNKTIDIRVSTLPTDFGEKVVLRILDKGSFDLELKNLGFKHRDMEHFKRAVREVARTYLRRG
jgi:type IV pilus assembly protein PilB